jgi:hypothetical protein
MLTARVWLPGPLNESPVEAWRSIRPNPAFSFIPVTSWKTGLPAKPDKSTIIGVASAWRPSTFQIHRTSRTFLPRSLILGRSMSTPPFTGFPPPEGLKSEKEINSNILYYLNGMKHAKIISLEYNIPSLLK